MLTLRPQQTESRRAEQNASDELADDRWLAEALGCFSEKARGKQDRDDRRDKAGLKTRHADRGSMACQADKAGLIPTPVD